MRMPPQYPRRWVRWSDRDAAIAARRRLETVMPGVNGAKLMRVSVWAQRFGAPVPAGIDPDHYIYAGPRGQVLTHYGGE